MGALSSCLALPVLGFFLPPTCFEWSGSEGSRSYFTSAWTCSTLPPVQTDRLQKGPLFKEGTERSELFSGLKTLPTGCCLSKSRALSGTPEERLGRQAQQVGAVARGTEHRAKNVLLCLLPSLDCSRVGFRIAIYPRELGGVSRFGQTSPLCGGVGEISLGSK